ncbi:MAG: pilus assembly protein PilM [Chloroflexota bacterium]
MAKRIVTLYVDDTGLRLLVVRDRQIEQWAELPLEPGVVKDNVVVKEAELAAQIRRLFQGSKVKTRKVIVGLSGLRCLSRPMTLPQLPRDMLDEAVPREARRSLPVPLDQLHISWQTIPAPEGKTRVFLAAVPRLTADALLNALRQAGLRPYFMSLKPLLLAKVMEQAMGVIVDVQTTEFDIVVVSGGVPQPVRTIPFASQGLSWQEKLTMIRNDVDRTLAFHNSNNPENPLGSSIPIFASGDLADESELLAALSKETEHPVLPLPSPLKCPDGFHTSRYMANIGLALHMLSSGSVVGHSAANLNALPMSYRPKPVSWANIVAWSGAVGAAALLVFGVLLVQSNSADIASTRVEVNAAEQRIRLGLAQSEEMTKGIAELQKKVADADVVARRFTTALGSLERQSTAMNRGLELAIDALPGTISLTAVSYEKATLNIGGRAPGESDVLSYLGNLNADGRFGEFTVRSMSRIEGKGIDFVLVGGPTKPRIEASSIEVATASQPATIVVTSIGYADGSLTIGGSSPDEDQVLLYARSLEASGRFADVVIANMTRSPGGEMIVFSLVLRAGR